MTPRTRRLAGALAVASLAAGVFLFVWLREPTQPLTAEALREARRLWERADIRDYHMRYRMADAVYDVTVSTRRPPHLLCDGLPATSNRPGDFTVDGLFDILELELEALNNPLNPFGGAAETTILRARFHPKLGYVERYLRVIGGTGKSHAIELLRFEPAAAPASDAVDHRRLDENTAP